MAVYPYTDENPAGHGNICQLVECTACGCRRNENRNQWHLEVSPWWDERGQRAEERRAANEEERANRNALAAIRDAYGNGPDVVRTSDGYIALHVPAKGGEKAHDVLIGVSLKDAAARAQGADGRKIREALQKLNMRC